MPVIETIATAEAMQAWSERVRQAGKTIAFVPTMGFLHEGHLSLMREGTKRCDELVVSIFVNPTQFGPGEDFEAYPRDLERDLDLVRREGAAAVFHPAPDALYGRHFQTYVTLENLPPHLCGIQRPIHFRGVATVVAKLFNIVKPHAAIFGQKDYQQLLVIRQMARDLNFDIEIVGAPIVREADGLAMSSRNTYLAPHEREAALSLFRSLTRAQELVAAGERSADRIGEAARGIIAAFPATTIDYITLADPETLETVARIDGPTLMALAVKVGKTRLIDNLMLTPSHS